MEVNYFTLLYWFCHTSTWIWHRYTRIPHSEPPSLLPPRTIPLVWYQTLILNHLLLYFVFYILCFLDCFNFCCRCKKHLTFYNSILSKLAISDMQKIYVWKILINLIHLNLLHWSRFTLISLVELTVVLLRILPYSKFHCESWCLRFFHCFVFFLQKILQQSILWVMIAQTVMTNHKDPKVRELETPLEELH